MQLGSVTWTCIPWAHKSSFEWVQSFCIKDHGKQHVFCGSGPGYNQNSLLDCLEQQCSTYPNSSHHSPDLAFQMSPHGSQPFLNRTITKLSLANGWRLFWQWHSLAQSHQLVQPSLMVLLQDWRQEEHLTHTPKHHSQTLPTLWCNLQE